MSYISRNGISGHQLKKLFIFQGDLEKQKIQIFCLLRENLPNTSTKEKNFL